MNKVKCEHEYRQCFDSVYSTYAGAYSLRPDGYYCIHCLKRIE